MGHLLSVKEDAKKDSNTYQNDLFARKNKGDFRKCTDARMRKDFLYGKT